MTKLIRLLLCLPMAALLGGCVGKDGGSSVEASTSSQRSRGDDDGKGREPRRVCENTSIGGEPKSFCY